MSWMEIALYVARYMKDAYMFTQKAYFWIKYTEIGHPARVRAFASAFQRAEKGSRLRRAMTTYALYAYYVHV